MKLALLDMFSLRDRQKVASEIAEMIRQQLEALPNERIVAIGELKLNIQVNFASGGGAKVEVSN